MTHPVVTKLLGTYKVHHMHLNDFSDGYGTEVTEARSMKFFTSVYFGLI